MYKKQKHNQKSSFYLQKDYEQIHPLRSLHNNNIERKCHTPSIYKPQKHSNPKKSLSKNQKEKNKSTQRQRSYLGYSKATKASEKYIDNSGYLLTNIQKKKSSNDGNWKFKNRPSSTLANVRHSKYLQFNLQNLNDSIVKNQSKQDQNILKIKDISHQYLDKTATNKQLYNILEEGKKCLKNNSFQKAIQYFKQYIKHDPEQLQTLYLLAICYFHLSNYMQSIKYFNNILLKHDNYKKNIYFFLSIAYKRVNDIHSAINVLTIVINKSPKYYDALIFRGKLLSKQKKYYQAIEDFNKCIKIAPQKVNAYASKADCLRFLMQLNQAINFYTQAIKRNQNDTDLNVLLKRAITYIEINKFSEAKSDLQQIIKIQPSNSEAYLFKGLVCYKCKNFNDAILSYQQAIKHNTSKKAITKSLYQISKIKIQMRDFYGASYTLQRADSLDVDNKILQKIRLFTDGSTFLMKKKIKRGVQLLTILIKKQNMNEYIKPLIYSFRAYGYFCQYKYTHALNDLLTMEKLGYNLDQASSYNKLLLEGIINCQNNKYDEALNKFNTTQKLKSNLSDLWIYKTLTYICIYNRSKDKSQDFLMKNLISAFQNISIAIQKQQSNSNAYYLRANILFTMHKMKQALQDIQKAIDKSDDHVMKHFYQRALIYSSMGMYKETLNDFGNVISLIKDLKQKQKNIVRKQDQQIQIQKQKDIPEAYLNRAKCYLIFGQKKRAFQDLQTYISYKPLDPQIHILAGRLLFSIGASEDAVKAYSHCPNIQKNTTILLERAKCYLLLKQLNHCLKDMQKIIQNGDNKIVFDYGCLESLRQASKGESQNFQKALKKIISVEDIIKGDGYIFQRADFHFYKGVFYFYLKQYAKSEQNFEKSYQLKKNSNSLDDLLTNQQESEGEQNFSNRIYTTAEIKYNISISKLLAGKKQQAFQMLSIYPEFNQIIKHSQISIQKQINQQEVQVTPFPVNNRLCSIFPALTYGKSKSFLFRLSFCLPRVLPPDMQLKISQNLIGNISINSTEVRPDAPWIKRNGFGVVFTQQVIGCDIDLNTQNEASQKKLDDENNEQGKGEQRSMQFDNYFNEAEAEKEERTRIKDLLTLDPQTEAKLAKLFKK